LAIEAITKAPSFSSPVTFALSPYNDSGTRSGLAIFTTLPSVTSTGLAPPLMQPLTQETSAAEPDWCFAPHLSSEM